MAGQPRLAAFVELSRSPPTIVNLQSLVDRCAAQHFVGRMSASGQPRSLPQIPEMGSETENIQNMYDHVQLTSHIQLTSQQMESLARQMTEVLVDREDRRAEEDERRLGVALEAVEEKAWEWEQLYSESWCAVTRERLTKPKKLPRRMKRLRERKEPTNRSETKKGDGRRREKIGCPESNSTPSSHDTRSGPS